MNISMMMNQRMDTSYIGICSKSLVFEGDPWFYQEILHEQCSKTMLVDDSLQDIVLATVLDVVIQELCF